jgi:hypothetical protein
VRIEPETINPAQHGDGAQVSAFVTSLSAPYRVTDIAPASIKLCYESTCLANTGTKLDGKAGLRATFPKADLIALVGTDHARVTLTVEGAVSGYPAGFVGSDFVRILSSERDVSTPAEGPGAAPVSPSPADQPTAAPLEAGSPSPSDVAPTPTPTPTATAVPASEPVSTPDPTPSAAPATAPTAPTG